MPQLVVRRENITRNADEKNFKLTTKWNRLSRFPLCSVQWVGVRTSPVKYTKILIVEISQSSSYITGILRRIIIHFHELKCVFFKRSKV